MGGYSSKVAPYNARTSVSGAHLMLSSTCVHPSASRAGIRRMSNAECSIDCEPPSGSIKGENRSNSEEVRPCKAAACDMDEWVRPPLSLPSSISLPPGQYKSIVPSEPSPPRNLGAAGFTTTSGTMLACAQPRTVTLPSVYAVLGPSGMNLRRLSPASMSSP